MYCRKKYTVIQNSTAQYRTVHYSTHKYSTVQYGTVQYKRDIEIHIKFKDEDGGYRKVRMEDFVDISKVPAFDNNAKWKIYTDRPPRRKLNEQAGNRARPSTLSGQDNSVGSQGPAAEKVERVNPLIRANSNTIRSNNKRQKTSAESSDDEMVHSDDSDFGTPSG